MNQTGHETAVITTTARVTAARLAIREARPRRLTSTLLWAAQILMGALFILLGLVKLNGGGVQEFGLIGAGQWLRYFVGAAELAGGIGLLTPWLAGLAAAGLAADMAGATIINATVLHNTTYGSEVFVTAILCAVFALIAYGRRRQIKALWAAIRRYGRPTGPGLAGSHLPIPGDAGTGNTP
jgi:uncharacterized membrane protein YphA (DoxX/SURF4 family)